MDLQYSEEQQLIARQAREFFEREFPLEAVRKGWAEGGPFPEALWRRMAELGWLGALLPERFGGQELTHTDFSRIAEETGRGLLPGPFLGTIAAAYAISLAAPEAVQAEVLPAVAEGACRMALARHGEGGRLDRLGGRFQASPDGDGVRLTGEKLSVPALAEAHRLVVAAAAADGSQAYYLVDPTADGVDIRPQEVLEGAWPLAGLRLNGVRVPAAHCFATAPESVARVDALLELALTFDALGGAQRLLEMASEYARIRTAFGNPIGMYQAVKHQCADMLNAVENLRVIAMWAGWVLDVPMDESGADPTIATAMARAAAIDAYDLAVRNGTQVQGAIAVTEEHDVHLYAKRSKALGVAFGSLAHYQDRILKASGF